MKEDGYEGFLPLFERKLRSERQLPAPGFWSTSRDFPRTATRWSHLWENRSVKNGLCFRL